MLSIDATPGPTTAARRERSAPWTVDVVLIVGLSLAALAVRAGPLGPVSLWLDDAWVGLVHRADELEELRRIGSSAPGFALLLRSWLAIAGFDETTAQLLPLAAGTAAPGLAYVVARRLRWSRLAALVAGVVLVTSPLAIDYATRVKQYTLESVVALVVVATAVWVLEDVGCRRRWTAFVAVGVLATATSAFLASYVAAGLAAGVVAARRRGHVDALWLALVAGATWGAFAALWYVVVLAPIIPTSLTGFWSGHFLVLDDGLASAARSVGDATTGVVEGLVPLPPLLTVVVVVAATVVVAVRRLEVAVLLAAPLTVALVLAALERAPLGGGRTDIYLYPSLALLVGGGADAVRRSVPGWRGAVVLAGACAVMAVAARGPVPYPRQDVRPLVEVLEQRARDDEAVLLYPATIWAYALYTADDVELTPNERGAWGFVPTFADTSTFGLPPGRDDPAAYAPIVARATAAVPRGGQLWLLASHWRDDYAALQERLGVAGFDRVEVVQEPGAELSRWRRR